MYFFTFHDNTDILIYTFEVKPAKTTTKLKTFIISLEHHEHLENLEFQGRIMKIMNIQNFNKKHEIYETLRIQCENNETHGNPRIPRENHENLENRRIPYEN